MPLPSEVVLTMKVGMDVLVGASLVVGVAVADVFVMAGIADVVRFGPAPAITDVVIVATFVLDREVARDVGTAGKVVACVLGSLCVAVDVELEANALEELLVALGPVVELVIGPTFAIEVLPVLEVVIDKVLVVLLVVEAETKPKVVLEVMPVVLELLALIVVVDVRLVLQVMFLVLLVLGMLVGVATVDAGALMDVDGVQDVPFEAPPMLPSRLVVTVVEVMGAEPVVVLEVASRMPLMVLVLLVKGVAADVEMAPGVVLEALPPVLHTLVVVGVELEPNVVLEALPVVPA
mmetsp:Transcript_23627/g.59679  ORF Transcript_23627/g.59679 Transcript_23627/m.59679 type:complete len:292 (-) Transcript_23627:23-898(-)